MILRMAEKGKVLNLKRPDDRVAAPPTDLLGVVNTPEGPFYKIDSSYMMPSSFPAAKSDTTFRIIVVGGSFALGTPYLHQSLSGKPGYGGIPDWLRAELALRYPSRNIEVINCAAGAQNSTRVYWIIRDLFKANPDLFIVLTGNNEGYLPATNFNEDLHRWILYRALKKAILPEIKLEDRSYFAPQDENTKKIQNRFQGNIQRIVRVIRDHDIDLLLATLPINLKYDHFDVGTQGEPIPYPKDDELIAKGRKLYDEGKYEEALKEYAASPNQAFASFFTAQSLEALGRYEQAGDFYKVFTENNPLNRMRPSFNEFIRNIGEAENIPVADLEKALEDSSPHGIPTPNLFVDYCHMTWSGYQLMAGRIAETLIGAGLIKGAESEPLPPPDIEQMIEANGWRDILQFP